MDKYEYKLKLEQIQNLFAAGDYLTAAEMADTINWKKVCVIRPLSTCLPENIRDTAMPTAMKVKNNPELRLIPISLAYMAT